MLGHEVAHIHAHHMARQQEKTQLLSYASLLAMLAAVVQPALAPLAAAAGQAAQLKYRREFEQEADYLGVRYLDGTGFDQRAMLDFFKKLERESRRVPTFIPPYLLSHPLTEERLNHLEAVLGVKQWDGHERRPPGTRLQRVQALARTRLGKPFDVLEHYEKLRRDHPNNPRLDYLFGVVALEVGRLDAAGEALTKAVAAGVQDAVREQGRLALRQRDPERASELLRKHLEAGPDDEMAWVELAKALSASGDAKAARDAYSRAWKLNPSLAEAHDGYGVLAGRAGEQGVGFYHLGRAARLRGKLFQSGGTTEARDPIARGDVGLGTGQAGARRARGLPGAGQTRVSASFGRPYQCMLGQCTPGPMASEVGSMPSWRMASSHTSSLAASKRSVCENGTVSHEESASSRSSCFGPQPA